MARNNLYSRAENIALPVPEGTESGDPVLVGAVAGVASTHQLEDGTATVSLVGSWSIDVTGAVAPGDVVYLGGSGLTASENTSPWGVALEEKGTGTGPAEVVPFGYVPPASAPSGA